MSEPRVVLLGRAGCHLCDEALAVVSRVCADLGEPWVYQDVDERPDLRSRFCDLVPVVQVDGVELSRYWVSAQALRQALA